MSAARRVVEAGANDIPHLLHLLDACRRTPGGGSHPLPGDVRERLAEALPHQPHLIALVALEGKGHFSRTV